MRVEGVSIGVSHEEGEAREVISKVHREGEKRQQEGREEVGRGSWKRSA